MLERMHKIEINKIDNLFNPDMILNEGGWMIADRYKSQFWQEIAERSPRSWFWASLAVLVGFGISIAIDFFAIDTKQHFIQASIFRAGIMLLYVIVAILAKTRPNLIIRYHFKIAAFSLMVIPFIIGIIAASVPQFRLPYYAGMVIAVFGLSTFNTMPRLYFFATSFMGCVLFVVPQIWLGNDVLPVTMLVTDGLIVLIAVFVAWFAQHVLLFYQEESFLRRQQLSFSEGRIRKILNSMSNYFIAVDLEWNIAYMNRRAEEVMQRLDYEPEYILHENLWLVLPNFFTAHAQAEIRRVPEERMMISLEEYFPDLDSYMEIQAYPTEEGVSIYMHDVTERKRLSEQLQRAQKMEALGSLSGGIAHDFNNLLTVIMGNAELGMVDDAVTDSTKQVFSEISDAATRGSELVAQLLAFARKQVIKPKVLDLKPVMQNSMILIQRTLGKNIEATIELPDRSLPASIDPGQIQQVILNLALNARDAMEGKGKLTIAATIRNRADVMHDWQVHLDSGTFIEIMVKDTGMGIPKENLNLVFEPFFTTKGVGKGTGLGLSMVYGIIKQLNGDIFVSSQPGLGTAFYLYFPLEKMPEPEIVEPAEDEKELEVSANQTFLVVEDELAIRTMMENLLTQMNQVVLSAENGEDAIRIMNDRNGKIDFIISDVVMPGISGIEMARSIWAEYPNVNILFMSGFSDDILDLEPEEKESIHFIRKPFTVRALVHKIHDMQNEGAAEKDTVADA